MPDSGITLTRDQLDTWAGFTLTDEEVELLAATLPRSVLPDTIADIAFALRPASVKPAETNGDQR
ncbi:hypothetical protein ACWEQL_00365 [Kitasatospora sp. NPDC004240]